MAVVVISAVVASGCLSTLSEAPGMAAELAPRQPLVVAVLDTGINPYHAAFRATPLADASSLAAEVGARQISLSESLPYADAAEADLEMLRGIARGELVHFENTRVLAIGLYHDSEDPPILDTYGHGTHVASLVARDAPHAILVMVKINPRYCEPGERCLIPSTTSEAMAWAADQPWIDVISVSLTLVANTPDHSLLHPESAAYLNAAKRAAENGKIIMTAAGNHGAPTIGSYLCGSPWVMCIGGADASGTGDVVWSGRGVDMIANFTETGASAQHESAYEVVHGTSFAAPIAAAIAAETKWHLRQANDLERQDEAWKRAAAVRVRAAMNLTAVAATAAEWEMPQMEVTPGAIYDRANTLDVPVLLPGQIGWGYLHAGLIPQVIANLDQPPEEGTPHAIAQARYQQAREEYWSRQ